MNATVDWLLGHDAVQSDRIGVTGFCMGGRVAWLAAASNPNFKAVDPVLRRQLDDHLGHGRYASF